MIRFKNEIKKFDRKNPIIRTYIYVYVYLKNMYQFFFSNFDIGSVNFNQNIWPCRRIFLTPDLTFYKLYLSNKNISFISNDFLFT